MEDTSNVPLNTTESEIQPNLQVPNPEPKPNNSKYKKVGIALLTVLALVILAGVVTNRLINNKQSENSLNTTVIPTTSSTKPTIAVEVKSNTDDWQTFVSEEFGIRFKLPPKFYWNMGRSTGGEGDIIKPYELNVDTFVREDVGKVSCDLMGTFLVEPNNCTNDMNITRLALFSSIGTEPFANSDIDNQIFNFFITETPSWISIEDSLGCGNKCNYYYDDPVEILGKEYKVRIYYYDLPKGRFTSGIMLEEEIPAGPNSKWRAFDIGPFLGFAEDAHTPYESGLSETSREILKTLEYID